MEILMPYLLHDLYSHHISPLRMVLIDHYEAECLCTSYDFCNSVH